MKSTYTPLLFLSHSKGTTQIGQRRGSGPRDVRATVVLPFMWQPEDSPCLLSDGSNISNRSFENSANTIHLRHNNQLGSPDVPDLRKCQRLTPHEFPAMTSIQLATDHELLQQNALEWSDLISVPIPPLGYCSSCGLRVLAWSWWMEGSRKGGLLAGENHRQTAWLPYWTCCRSWAWRDTIHTSIARYNFNFMHYILFK